MSDAKDVDYEVVEVKVSKKIAITLSPGEVLALAQKKAEAAAGKLTEPQQVAERAGTLARLGQRLKATLFGRGQPPKDSG